MIYPDDCPKQALYQFKKDIGTRFQEAYFTSNPEEGQLFEKCF